MGAQASRQLLDAAACGNVRALQRALKRADINTADEDGWTALHYSAWVGGSSAFVAALLEAGANAEARDKGGRSPLHLAAISGNTEAITVLCSRHCVPVNAIDRDGSAPLHKAIAQRHAGTVQALMGFGADVALPLPDNTTPLHLAACSGHAGILRLLLAKGAEVDAQNCNGQTPLFEAAAAGQLEALRMLLLAGANPGHRDRRGMSASDLATHDAALLLRQGPGHRLAPASVELEQQTRPNRPKARAWMGLFRQVQVAPSPELLQAPAAHPLAGCQSTGGPQLSASNNAPPAVPSAPPLPLPMQQQLDGTGTDAADAQQPEHGMPPAPADTPAAEERIVGDILVAWLAQVAAAAYFVLGSLLGHGWQAPSAVSAGSDSQLPAPNGTELRRMGRYGLVGDGRDEGEVGEEVPARSSAAAEGLGNSMERRTLRAQPAEPFCRLFRFQGLWQATAGYSHRLDPPRSLSEAWSGRLPSEAAAAEGKGGREVVVRVMDWVEAPRQTLAWAHVHKLAELTHPHVLPLLGMSQDYRKFVYEAMPNGSLDDALHGRRARRNAAAPVCLDWCARMRIAAEVAAGLQHLHSLGVKHARLQPSAVLLDGSLTARLGDAGLEGLYGPGYQMRQAPPYTAPENATPAAYLAGHAAGGHAADVFSFGVTLLQLMSGSSPKGLAQHAQSILASGSLVRFIDPCALGWLEEDAAELCQLALMCLETSPGDRPSLKAQLLPALRRLADRASTGAALAESADGSTAEPPAMLICPITQELMQDHVVLADGHSYERAAIQQWLDAGKRTSPMTNLRLAHRALTPNHTLRSAALEWQAARPNQAM